MTLESYEWHAKICRAKKRYGSKAEAREGLKLARRRYEHAAHQHPYECGICQGWHLSGNRGESHRPIWTVARRGFGPEMRRRKG